MSHEYDVFLSYNKADETSVARIARVLSEKHSLKPWFDKWNLVPGDPWQEGIEEALPY
jgi:TIR domain-containing protein